MFLQKLKEKNPMLLKTAVKWHQENKIPCNTWLVDLDAIRDNAEILNKNKEKYGLETYVMSKQHGRNPLINLVAIQEGLNAIVCVDIQCVRMMARYNVPVGHVGHLNQIPKKDIEFVLGLHPEVWTVFSKEQAKLISDSAVKLGVTQQILLRVCRDGDIFFPGQEGGFRFDELIQEAAEIMKMPNIKIVGTVSFPCFTYNRSSSDVAEPSPNMKTIVEAAKKLHDELGIEIKQINAPGNTSSWTLPILKENGATHVEPGHGLLGTTPNHRLFENMPERPTYCYVSEITHKYEGMAYAHGGGLWQDIYDPEFQYKALVGSDPENIVDNELSWNRITQIIDYHAPLLEGDKCKVGDTAVFGFRTQTHMTRSWTVYVKGLNSGQPEFAGIFDNAGHMLDPNTLEALPLEEARNRVNKVVESYKKKELKACI